MLLKALSTMKHTASDFAYIVGLGEYDSAVAEKFFPCLPFIREERAAKRMHFHRKITSKKASSYTQQNLVVLEKIVAVETRDMEPIADIKDAKIEINVAALNDNTSSGTLSPSSSLLNMLKGGDATKSSFNADSNDSNAISFNDAESFVGCIR